MIKAIYFNLTENGYSLTMYEGFEISKPKRCFVVSDEEFAKLSSIKGRTSKVLKMVVWMLLCIFTVYITLTVSIS